MGFVPGELTAIHVPDALDEAKPKVTVALAREMAGFVWAMLRLVPVPPPTPPPAGPLLRRT